MRGCFGVLALVVFSLGRHLLSLRVKFTRESFPPSTVTASALGRRRQHFLSDVPTSDKKETKEQYLKRLRSTALGLPSSVVENAVRHMYDRVRKVVDASGGLFTE